MKRDFYMAVGAVTLLILGLMAFFLSDILMPSARKKTPNDPPLSLTPISGPFYAPASSDAGVSEAAQAVAEAASQIQEKKQAGAAVKKKRSFEPGSRIKGSEMHDSAEQTLFYDTVDEDALSSARGSSYAAVRRYLDDGRLPPPDKIRIDEMVDHFSYGGSEPEGDEPVSVTVELGDSPWNRGRKIALVAVKAKKLGARSVQPSSLVILVGTSEAAGGRELSLTRSALRQLADELGPRDKISLVSASGMVIEGAAAGERTRILEAIDGLRPGSIGTAAIRQAYEAADKHAAAGGNNRVVLMECGPKALPLHEEIAGIVKERTDNTGILFSRVRFNRPDEARKALVGQLARKAARDVRIEVDVNPSAVKSCRLIGYADRPLEPSDSGGGKSARDMDDGQSMSALYEIEPVAPKEGAASGGGEDLLTVKVQYKAPDGDTIRLIAQSVPAGQMRQPSIDLKFASAVAEFGLLLSHSSDKGSADMDRVLARAEESIGSDEDGRRTEFIGLVRTAGRILDSGKK